MSECDGDEWTDIGAYLLSERELGYKAVTAIHSPCIHTSRRTARLFGRRLLFAIVLCLFPRGPPLTLSPPRCPTTARVYVCEGGTEGVVTLLVAPYLLNSAVDWLFGIAKAASTGGLRYGRDVQWEGSLNGDIPRQGYVSRVVSAE